MLLENKNKELVQRKSFYNEYSLMLDKTKENLKEKENQKNSVLESIEKSSHLKVNEIKSEISKKIESSVKRASWSTTTICGGASCIRTFISSKSEKKYASYRLCDNANFTRDPKSASCDKTNTVKSEACSFIFIISRACESALQIDQRRAFFSEI